MASHTFARVRFRSARLGKRLSSGLWLCLLGGVMMTSCASTQSLSGAAPELAEADSAGGVLEQGVSADSAADSGSGSGSALPVEPGSPSQAKPQLIKTANLSIQVEDTTATIQTISQLMAQERGDILNLSESGFSGDRQSAELSLRVPAQRLGVVLEQLTGLGKVSNRNVSARDVSGQIVDTDARLRNLRKQEEMILKIMEQSGEISDVLAVSQELANVRQSIEQIDAQLKLLTSQVAYSTISLYLTEPATFSAPNRTKFSTELKNTWDESTDAVFGFTRGLIKLGLALLVWSPYLGILALLIWGANRSLRKQRDRKLAAKAGQNAG